MQTMAATKQRTFLGHPIGLFVLFFTEMWERFSYYGMRGLLLLYLIDYFLMSQREASRIYKWYTTLVYLTPLLGGYLADRFLGNKRAVIIGALLMATGQFLLSFEDMQIFYIALLFMIFGNGFFKPNMSTQVGRLYPAGDPRLDSAYTIFYMGINLGAFFAPLLCGWLADKTIGGYHSGFTAAGIGMILGLVIYLVGQPWVRETVEPAKNLTPVQVDVPSEAQTEHLPSVIPHLNRMLPTLLVCLGGLLVVGAPVLLFADVIQGDALFPISIAGFCAFIAAWVTSQTHHAERDRVLSIGMLGIFVVFFWCAFEQAGNVMNLWAAKYTDRAVTGVAPPPSPFPPVQEEKKEGASPSKRSFWERWRTMFQLKPSEKVKPTSKQATSSGFIIPTPWFQSINALAIFVLAPVFAFMWTTLGRRGWNPSIPTKMAMGVLLMGLSLAVMIGAASREDQPSSIQLQKDRLPEAIGVNAAGQVCPREKDGKLEAPYHSGRLRYDETTHTLHMTGILTDMEHNQLVRDTAPEDYKNEVIELQKKSKESTGKEIFAQVHLDRVPPGFDMRYAGFPKDQVNYEPLIRTLTTHKELADKDVKMLLVAGGDPQWRKTLDELLVESSAFRVSPWWLVWHFVLATLGELCLSPVGLSMVSKLAPARFATMLMGMWFLTSFFGNFGAGAMGELWDTTTPANYFFFFMAALVAASLVLFLLVRKIVALMHGVT